LLRWDKQLGDCASGQRYTLNRLAAWEVRQTTCTLITQNKFDPTQDQIHHCGKLSSTSRDGESAMINRENELPQFPLVEAALKAIADWVTSYRKAIGFNNEFGMCGPDEVMRMAKDIGVTPSQLQYLVRKGPDSANLLKRMLVALHVDPKIIADMDPLVMREMQWLCIACNNKKRCEHELAKGTATKHFHEFCPNAMSIDELLDQKGQLSSH
jgi:hypothetical protein